MPAEAQADVAGDPAMADAEPRFHRDEPAPAPAMRPSDAASLGRS